MKSNGIFLSDADFFRGAAILILLFIIAVAVPVFGSISLIFSPLPIIYYSLKIGRMKAMALTFLALSLATAAEILWAVNIHLIVLYLFSVLGLMLSETLRRGYGIEKTIIYPAVLLCLTSFILLFYHGQQSGKRVLEILEFYIAGNIQESIKIYMTLDLPAEQINVIRDNAHRITQFFTKIYPSLVAVAISFTVWVNVLAARVLFEKNAVPYPSYGDLACWKAPEKTVWFLIAGGLIIFLAAGDLKFVGWNGVIICAFIYLMQGLAIIGFLFKRKNVPKILKIVFYFLIFAQQYILLLVTAVGLFDLWVDFRKYIKPLNGAAAS